MGEENCTLLTIYNYGTLQEETGSFRAPAKFGPASINNRWRYDLNTILNDPDYISGV